MQGPQARNTESTFESRIRIVSRDALRGQQGHRKGSVINAYFNAFLHCRTPDVRINYPPNLCFLTADIVNELNTTIKAMRNVSLAWLCIAHRVRVKSTEHKKAGAEQPFLDLFYVR